MVCDLTEVPPELVVLSFERWVGDRSKSVSSATMCERDHVGAAMAWHNTSVAESTSKKHYVDNGWPKAAEGDGPEHAVSEFAADLAGALSPFGDVEFPLPADEVHYINPKTVINR